MVVFYASPVAIGVLKSLPKLPGKVTINTGKGQFTKEINPPEDGGVNPDNNWSINACGTLPGNLYSPGHTTVRASALAVVVYAFSHGGVPDATGDLWPS
jgi:hypothetical protein